MKFLAILALAAALGIVLYQRGVFNPPPPPPPPPPIAPAILSEPAPVINEALQQKVLKSATDQDWNVRWEAVLLLDKMKSPKAMPLMQDMLSRDMEPLLRIRLLDLLGNRRGDEVIASVVGALKDQEPEVRLAALKALEKIGDLSVAAAIADGPIRDSDESVRLQALKTLNSLQDKKQKEIDAARERYEADKAASDAAARAAAQKK